MSQNIARQEVARYGRGVVGKGELTWQMRGPSDL
jgi:hypothetical protein